MNDNAVDPVPGRPRPNQRPIDDLVVDLGGLPVPGFDLQALLQQAQDAVAKSVFADCIELRLVS